MMSRRPPVQARGFTLIEVLVAVVVLSFGLLGMVGLQGASLKANREARLQASGVRLASEMGDMMRGNKQVSILTNATDNPYLQSNFTGTVTAASPNCFSAVCTTTKQVATADVADWLARVANELPGARVVICFDATPFDAAGKPQWTCSNTGGVVNVKIGWTRGSTNRAAVGTAALEGASDTGVAPVVVLPVTVGNSL
ncbi:Type IV pilus modification protein PilV [Burkholderiales bacterium 8X]|nr:Type IV pilus modification protein PilV [Burkholderiales bacterium 8X]